MEEKIELEQVFLNMITNSQDALSNIPKGSKKLISIRSSIKDSKVFVEISDNGHEMPKEIINKVIIRL